MSFRDLFGLALHWLSSGRGSPGGGGGGGRSRYLSGRLLEVIERDAARPAVIENDRVEMEVVPL